MQLRPRDGTGRAVTANDGKLRSFTKILDNDESDDLTYGNVQGGQVYQMLKGGPADKYIKFKEYKQDDDTNKKVPRIRNTYTIVKGLVAGCNKAANPASDPAKWDFKEIEAIRKYYVGNNLLKDTDFAKILKEQKLLNKIEPDENVTDHSDVKAFVDDAIASYRKMHPNRPIALDNVDYKKFVNKVLIRVRANYLKRAGDFSRLKTNNNNPGGVNSEPSVYSAYAANSAITLDTKPATGTSARATARADISKLIDQIKNEAIIVDIDSNKTRKLAESDVDATMPTAEFKALDIFFLQNDAASDLKLLLEEMYKQFVRRTEKLIKKDHLIQYEFKADGGRKHRSGRKPVAHHSRPRDGAHKSGHKRRAGRSHRK